MKKLTLFVIIAMLLITTTYAELTGLDSKPTPKPTPTPLPTINASDITILAKVGITSITEKHSCYNYLFVTICEIDFYVNGNPPRQRTRVINGKNVTSLYYPPLRPLSHKQLVTISSATINTDIEKLKVEETKKRVRMLSYTKPTLTAVQLLE